MSNLATNLSSEDEAAIKSILIGYRDAGTKNPLLPTEVDMNGDGTADSFGLDENDNVIVVLGVKLDETVFVSDGDDIGPLEDEVDTPKRGYADNDVPKGR